MFLFIIIKKKRPHPKPTNLLQNIYYGIVLEAEAIESAIMFIYCLNLKRFLLIILVEEGGLFDFEFAGDEGFLQSDFQIIGIVVLLIIVHLLNDEFLGLLEGAL